MTAPAQKPQTPVGSVPAPGTPAPPTKLPQAVIDQSRFEGKEVHGTLITVAGTAKMTPQNADADNTILTHDDVATVQMDVKVTGIGYDTNKDGQLIRVQRVRPIEGTVIVVDVLRKLDTKIR